jgi:radical SAM superfamily enzyme YgiQ (UPF0313 family)
MARVVLVQPPHRDTFGYSMPPLGILHAGAGARERGHEVVFLDFALMVRRGQLRADDGLIGRCADRILEQEPDVLGLGAMISAMPAALHLAAEVRKRRGDLPVILGGQGPETVEEAVLARHAAIDAVAVGEADLSLADCLDRLGAPPGRTSAADRVAHRVRDWAEVPGLVVRRDGLPHRTAARPLIDCLDDVPGPDWSLAEPPLAYAEAAGEREAMFPIDLGRGCTFDCSFCTTPGFWGRAARQLSPARAVDELDRLAAMDGLGCAYVTHDLFTVDRRRVLDICEEKLRRGNTLAWECRTRIDLVDEELLEAMGAAGCRRILYGVESDSPEVLARVNKGGRAAGTDVRATLRAAARAGVASIVGVMAGVPGESPDDLERNLVLMADAAVVDGTSLSLHWFNVTPGNAREQEVAAAGAALSLEPGLHADLVRGHDLPAGHVAPEQAALIAADDEIFAGFRVFALPPETPRALYLLTRNAHLLLEVMPRTLRALARLRDTTLRATLGAFLEGLAGGPDPSRARGAAPADAWDEPLVLRREAGIALLAGHARAAGDARVTALADYERALFETTEGALVRFEVDPVPLVRALDAGPGTEVGALPDPSGPGAVLFLRRGERTAAHALSPFLADVYERLGEDDLAASLASQWPSADDRDVGRAKEMLTTLCGAPR